MAVWRKVPESDVQGTHTHTHTHTHTLQIHALLVMGWYNEKKTTDQ